MDNLFEDCPKCGMKNSAWPGRYCGKCEEKYQKEMEECLHSDYRQLLANWPYEDMAPPSFWDWASGRF